VQGAWDVVYFFNVGVQGSFMARSNIAGTPHRSKLSIVACALVLSLGAGGASQAASQAALQSLKYSGAPVFAGAADKRGAAGAEVLELDDCDPQPLRMERGSYPITLAKADLERKPARAVRGKKTATVRPITDGVAFATAVPAAAVAANGSREWEIMVTDKTLNATMARWAATAGWQLLWELPVDYAVEARTKVHGTFEEAVGIVAGSMETAEIPMKAVFYQGNRVLRIMAKGSE
jgi:hypothetical protein